MIKQKTIHVCDRCGGDCPFPTMIFPITDHGLGRLDDVEALDLCAYCAHQLLEDIVREQGLLDRVLWLKEVKAGLPEPAPLFPQG